jgi:predicted amidohydrolase
MKNFGIAGIQINLFHGDNMPLIEQRIDVLMSLYPWVDMVVLSELSPHGPLLEFAETMPGPTEERFCDIARKHGLWLVPGSIFEKRDDLIYNTAPVIDPQGTVIARHSKLFPFRPFEEGVEAGSEFVVFDVPGAGRFGLCICYDMWFPEVTRTLTSMGAEVILHPVLTGTNDRTIELNLACATGALFQSYVFDINGLGVGGVGHSCVIDPAGQVVHQAGSTDEFLVVEVDFELVRRQREAGLRNLGQPLKSFRDRGVEFEVYNREKWGGDYLDSLGPLAKPSRDSKTQLAPDPAIVEDVTRHTKKPPPALY